VIWTKCTAWGDSPASCEARGSHGERYELHREPNKNRWKVTVDGKLLGYVKGSSLEGRQLCEDHASGARGAA
jgi:hypothetical protein